jgi:hypothetical protein
MDTTDKRQPRIGWRRRRDSDLAFADFVTTDHSISPCIWTPEATVAAFPDTARRAADQATRFPDRRE